MVRRVEDKINWKALYKDSTVTSDSIKNDFVKFRIGVIDNDDTNLKTYIHLNLLTFILLYLITF